MKGGRGVQDTAARPRALAAAHGGARRRTPPGAGRAVAAGVRAVRDESVRAPAVLVWIAAYAVLARRRVSGDRGPRRR
jgi:hypothetical protein